MKYITILLFAFAGCQNCENCKRYVSDNYGTEQVEKRLSCDKEEIRVLETLFSDSTDYWVCE